MEYSQYIVHSLLRWGERTGCCCFKDDESNLYIAVLNNEKPQDSDQIDVLRMHFSKNKLTFVAAKRDGASRCSICTNRQPAMPSRRKVLAAVWPGGVHTRVNSGICLCGISIVQRGSFYLPEGAVCLFSEYDSSPEVHHKPASPECEYRRWRTKLAER